MDFKVAGSENGVTAMQLDVKLDGGVPIDIVIEALFLAKKGRHQILSAMGDPAKGGIKGLHPRLGLKSTAPRVEVIRFDPIRKRDLIGPGGIVLKQLEERFGVSLVRCP